MSVGSPNSQQRSTQVITLKPGEQFSLPPGADVVYSSDVSATQSECQLNMQWTERCYRFAFENQNNIPVNDAVIVSYIVDGNEMPLNTPFSYVITGLENALTDNIPLGLYTFVTTCHASGNVRIVFKSIGKEVYLKVMNPTGHDSVGGGQTFFLIPAEQVTPCGCDGQLGDENSIAY